MADDNLLIILGNQLFPLEEIKKTGAKKIFMKEDLGLCTDFKPVSYTHLTLPTTPYV